MGLKDLPPEKAENVRIGNHLLMITFSLAMMCFLSNIPGSVGNPFSFRMWLTRCMKRFPHKTQAVFTNVVYCAVGERWRKRTSFLHWLAPALGGLSCDCIMRNGLCQYQGKRHLALEGSAPKGGPLTAIASRYPKNFCRKLANIVSYQMIAAHVNTLARLVSPTHPPFDIH